MFLILFRKSLGHNLYISGKYFVYIWYLSDVNLKVSGLRFVSFWCTFVSLWCTFCMFLLNILVCFVFFWCKFCKFDYLCRMIM